MNNETSFNRIDHMKKFARRGIVFGALLGIACLAVPILHVSALTFEETLRKEQATPLGPQVKPGAASEPISTIQLNPTGRAVAAPAGETIYITRYLPDIIKGSKGPAEMVFLFYKYLMGLVGIVAVGVIMYGGVLRTVSADPSKIRASNEYIKNALKGIVLLFGAQVLFNTINPNIIDIQRIQRALQPSERIVPGALTETSIGIVAEGEMQGALEPGGGKFSGGGASGSWGDDTSATKSKFSSIGVGMLPECKPGGSTKGCISFQGVKPETLDAIQSMAQAGIPVSITSVTEGSHAVGTYSHANGYKWDMKPIDQKYFAGQPDRFEKATTRSDSSATYNDKVTGAQCSLEKPRTYKDKNTGKTVNIVEHWDCTINPKG